MKKEEANRETEAGNEAREREGGREGGEKCSEGLKKTFLNVIIVSLQTDPGSAGSASEVS